MASDGVEIGSRTDGVEGDTRTIGLGGAVLEFEVDEEKIELRPQRVRFWRDGVED